MTKINPCITFCASFVIQSKYVYKFWGDRFTKVHKIETENKTQSI